MSTKKTSINEVSPIDALKAKVRAYGVSGGSAETDYWQGVTSFAALVGQGSNVFPVTATDKLDALKDAVQIHARPICEAYCEGKAAGTDGKVISDSSAKKYLSDFVLCGIVAARAPSLIPELDGIVTTFCKTSGERKALAFYRVLKWIRDTQHGDKKTAGRAVTLDEIKADGFAAACFGNVVARATKGKDAAPKDAAPKDAAPKADAPKADAPAVDYLVMLRECASKLNGQADIDPIVARAIALILNA